MREDQEDHGVWDRFVSERRVHVFERERVACWFWWGCAVGGRGERGSVEDVTEGAGGRPPEAVLFGVMIVMIVFIYTHVSMRRHRDVTCFLTVLPK